MPFLAHATMEPMNCTVNLKKDSCEIFLGSQVVARVQSEVAKLLELSARKRHVHNHLLGGGFGRRLEPDMALSAVRVAQKVDGPLKVVWTREEDIQHDVYRPVYRDTISASLSERQDRRLEVQGDGICRPGQVAAAGIPEGDRYRRHR